MSLFDDVPAAPTGGGGMGLNLGGDLLPKLLSALQPPDKLRALQIQLLEIEIAKKQAGGAVPYAIASWQMIPPDREDFVALGPRGSGKTSFAVALAQHLSTVTRGHPVIALDWPEPIARTFGFRTGNWHTIEQSHDAIVIIDEARLHVPQADLLWRVMSLARHRGLHLIYTTQTTAGVSKDVLRLGPVLCWKRPSRLGAAFEREELTEAASRAALIFAALDPQGIDKSLTVLQGEQGCAVTSSPIPVGWTQKTSTLWR